MESLERSWNAPRVGAAPVKGQLTKAQEQAEAGFAAFAAAHQAMGGGR